MNCVDIVLIDPPTTIMEKERKSRHKISGHLPNLGICILAAVAEREGYKIAIIDAVAMQFSFKEILAELKHRHPKYVGISAMTHTIIATAAIAQMIKEAMPRTVVIIGGVHITATTEETLRRYPGSFDVAVIGEGEATFVELLEVLEKKGDLSLVAGIAYLCEGIFVKTPPRNFIKNMDSLPFPAWHLLPDMAAHYGTTLISAGNKPSNHLLTSRGCPGRCIFCDTSVNGHTIRGYSADYVMEMIEILHKKYGVNDIQFNDDTFVTLRKRLFDICERLIKKSYNLTWSCDARARDVTEEGLALMKDAGCWQIAYGVETGAQKILDAMDKKVTFEHMKNAFKWAKKAGITTKGFFIFGHPQETLESIQETVDFMLSLDPDVVGITFFTAFPGSPIYPTVNTFGEFDPDWDRTNTYEIGNFIPHGFTAEQLVRLRKQALTQFYFRPKYILKQIVNIKKPYDAFRLISGGLRILSKNVLNIQ